MSSSRKDSVYQPVLPRISPGDLRPEQLTIAVGVDLQTSSWGLILRTRELLFVGPGSLFVGLALDPEGESMHFGFPAAVYPWLTFGVQTVTGATTATVAWFVARISKRQAGRQTGKNCASTCTNAGMLSIEKLGGSGMV
jgi:hypothetical protein